MYQVNYLLIGRRIKEARQLQEISQSMLAEMTGMSVTYISNIETASKHVSLPALITIADALDLTVSDLLYGNQPESPAEYQTDLDILMGRCTPEERRFVFEMVKAAVQALRINGWHFS